MGAGAPAGGVGSAGFAIARCCFGSCRVLCGASLKFEYEADVAAQGRVREINTGQFWTLYIKAIAGCVSFPRQRPGEARSCGCPGVFSFPPCAQPRSRSRSHRRLGTDVGLSGSVSTSRGDRGGAASNPPGLTLSLCVHALFGCVNGSEAIKSHCWGYCWWTGYQDSEQVTSHAAQPLTPSHAHCSLPHSRHRKCADFHIRIYSGNHRLNRHHVPRIFIPEMNLFVPIPGETGRGSAVTSQFPALLDEPSLNPPLAQSVLNPQLHRPSIYKGATTKPGASLFT